MNEENQETNSQEPSVYQPVSEDQNLLQQIEGAEITGQTPAQTPTPTPTPIQTPAQTPAPVTTAATPVQNPIVVPTEPPAAPTSPKKSHRGLKIVLIAIASVLAITAIGLAVFYFVIRTPNSEYDAAVQNLQTMKTSADAIHGKKIDSTMSADARKTQSDIIKKNATAYVGALVRLQGSPVLKKDMQVKLSYVENKSLVEAYGQSSLDILETTTTYEAVHSTCANALNGSFGATKTSLSSLDGLFSECKKLIAEHPTVPNKAFNDTVYVKYVAAVKQIMKGIYEYTAGSVPGSGVDTSDAINDVNEGISNYTEVDQSASENKVTNTAQPSDKISDIIKVVQQQKNVFFRW